jgi:hypothetical protein
MYIHCNRRHAYLLGNVRPAVDRSCFLLSGLPLVLRFNLMSRAEEMVAERSTKRQPQGRKRWIHRAKDAAILPQ